MRKVIVSNIVSADGFFAAADGSLDWFIPGDDFFEYSVNMLDSMGVILFGANTYKMMEAYWTSPLALQNQYEIAWRMNSLQKVVFSHTLANVSWNNATLANGDIATEVNRLKQQPGKDLVILGSGQIVSALTNLQLIDEYRIIQCPVLLGSGKPLFRDLENRVNLRLMQAKVLSDGVAILYYTR